MVELQARLQLAGETERRRFLRRDMELCPTSSV
jgi:hypothetical protein